MTHDLEIECPRCGSIFRVVATSWNGYSLFAGFCKQCGAFVTDEDAPAAQRVLTLPPVAPDEQIVLEILAEELDR